MNAHLSRRRRLMAVGAALCCGTFLAVPAANAASPYDPASGIGAENGTNVSSGCTSSNVIATGTPGVHLVTNAKPTSAKATSAVTATNSADATDTLTVSASITGKGSLRSSGGHATAMDLSMTGKSSSTSSKATSGCTATADPSLMMEALVTITRPTVATIDALGLGQGGYQLIVAPSTSSGPFSSGSTFSITEAQSVRTHTTMYLAPGKYEIGTGLVVMTTTTKSSATTSSGHLHVAFAAAGSRTAASSAGYVTMPVSRSCASHKVSPRITTSAKKVKQIKSIAFRVNGKLVKTVSHPVRGASVKLAATDNAPTTVTATVKVKAHGHRTRTVTSTASYLQCS